MTARAPGVTISRANLAVPADQGMDGRRTALASLDRVHWPRSSETEDAWLFLRRLDINAQAADLGSFAVKQAAEFDAAAVDGWRAGSHDMAVRFASRADLLARLCRDLAMGKADLFWFWDTMRAELPNTTAADGIEAILAREPIQLLSVLQILQVQGVLTTSLRQLAPEAIARVCTALMLETGWPIAALLAGDAADPSTVVIPIKSVARFRFWSDVLELDLEKETTLAQFMAVIALWETAPYLLITDAVARTALVTILRDGAFSETRSFADTASKTHTEQNGPDEETPTLGAVENKGIGHQSSVPSSAEIAPDSDSGLGQVQRPLANKQPKSFPEMDKIHITGDRNLQPLEDWNPLARTHAVVSKERGAPLFTQSGGVLFLLNVLNLNQVQNVMTTNPVSGWYWLWRLAHSLDFHPDASMERFLMQALDLKTAADLIELPALAGEDQIASIAARRFDKFGVWSPDLLQRKAAIRAARTHVDVDMHQDTVDLGVRQSGLDMDPGWLPWLGKIVRFHFGTDPMLAPTRTEL